MTLRQDKLRIAHQRLLDSATAFRDTFTHISFPDYQKDFRYKDGGYQFRNIGQEFGWGKAHTITEALDILDDLHEKYTKGNKTIVMLCHIKNI